MTEVDEVSGVAVIFDPKSRGTIDPKPTVTWWTYVRCWCWNLCRRPLVRKRQKKIELLFKRVKEDMEFFLFPQMIENGRAGCSECLVAFTLLRHQEFLSTMKSLLQRSTCVAHYEMYRDFLCQHENDFEMSEYLSRWINGFE